MPNRLTPEERKLWERDWIMYGKACVKEDKDGNVRYIPVSEIYEDEKDD